MCIKLTSNRLKVINVTLSIRQFFLSIHICAYTIRFLFVISRLFFIIKSHQDYQLKDWLR